MTVFSKMKFDVGEWVCRVVAAARPRPVYRLESREVEALKERVDWPFVIFVKVDPDGRKGTCL